MPNYRRYFVPGATYFFTVVTAGRAPLFREANARELFGNTMRDQQRQRPFEVKAIVLLPDHLHTIWSLPRGDADYSLRWSAIKGQFTRDWLATDGAERPLFPGQAKEGRRGVWQPRFMEHTIRDEEDLTAHVDYIHYNPVKHGLARCPKDWPWSSFARFVAAGDYPLEWGCREHPTPTSILHVNADLLE